jgi:hypothetical protein
MSVGGATSAWKHGTNGNVSVNTDFTAYTLSVNPSFDAEEVDATTFGDTYRDFEQSYKNATIDVEMKFDATRFGQMSAIYNGGDTVTWQLSPAGTANPSVKIEGSMVMTKFNPSVQVGDLIKMAMTWRVTGAVTFGVHS